MRHQEIGLFGIPQKNCNRRMPSELSSGSFTLGFKKRSHLPDFRNRQFKLVLLKPQGFRVCCVTKEIR